MAMAWDGWQLKSRIYNFLVGPRHAQPQTSQELRMLSKFRNLSIIVNCDTKVTNSLDRSQSKTKSLSLEPLVVVIVVAVFIVVFVLIVVLALNLNLNHCLCSHCS